MMLSHRRVLLQAFSLILYVELSSRKIERRDERETRGREKAAGTGGRQTSKMKLGARGGMKRMTISEIRKHCVEKGGTHRETKHRNPELAFEK